MLHPLRHRLVLFAACLPFTVPNCSKHHFVLLVNSAALLQVAGLQAVPRLIDHGPLTMQSSTY